MNETATKLWYKTLEIILKLPGAKVEREKFLRKEFLKSGCSEEQIESVISSTPVKAGISEFLIEDISRSCIRSHQLKATMTSTITGLPGGFLGIGTIPADLIQFYWHIIVLIQKLAYLHGWPDIMENKEEIDHDILARFTLFIGVMMGMNSAKKGLGIMTQIYTKNTLSTVRRFLNSSIAKIIEKIALRLGIKLGRERISKTIGVIIPVVGGTISGITTFNAIGSMGENLRSHLSRLPFAKSSYPD
ncbi:MAG TPA: hypothetical protein PL110_14755 [Candidatus Eremiobacteraeota bacterium]|nr:hypothetical protein [Candidatus Eremiobacteraeota bacterium]